MSDEFSLNGKTIRLIVGFITDIKDMDGLVYYARSDLKLGAGFGTAISIQGGPKVQEELKKIGSANMTDVVVTGGGNLQTRYILHAVGPQFQEEDSERKTEGNHAERAAEGRRAWTEKNRLSRHGSGILWDSPGGLRPRHHGRGKGVSWKKRLNRRRLFSVFGIKRELKVFQEYLQTMRG